MLMSNSAAARLGLVAQAQPSRPSRNNFDFAEIKNALPSLLEMAARDVRLARKSAREYVGLCPFHAERTPSFYVYQRGQQRSAERFHCFGCGADGDVIDFLAAREGRSIGSIARDLTTRAPTSASASRTDQSAQSIQSSASPRTAAPQMTIQMPVPAHAEPIANPDKSWTTDIIRPRAEVGQPNRQRLKIDCLHEHRDFSGELLGYVVRACNSHDGRKFTPSVVWASDVTLHDGTVAEGWAYGAFPTPRCPYGAPLFTAGLGTTAAPTVLLVEGEKCQEAAASALQDQDVVPLSWIGGSNAWRHTGWRVIAERSASIILWPDADKAGRDAMQALAAHLHQLGARNLRWLDPDPGRSDGWDIADSLQQDHWSSAHLNDVLATATPFPNPTLSAPVTLGGERR